MPSAGEKVFYDDHAFCVFENVYEPAEDTFLFAENLDIQKDDMVFDIGTGCGMLSILAAEKTTHVVAVDINPFAVRCAKENARLNHVGERLSFVQGDLFTSLRLCERFDVILFNAPYLPSESSEEVSWLEQAWVGGVSGRTVIDRFIVEAPKYLKSNGHVLLMQSTLSDVDKTLYMFERSGLKASVTAKRDLPFFESIVLIRAEFLKSVF